MSSSSCALALAASIALLPIPTAADCGIRVNGLAFGSYDPLANRYLQGRTAVDYVCSVKTMATIQLVGLADSGDSRAMRKIGGGDELRYKLFRDPGLVYPWGSEPYYLCMLGCGNVNIFGLVPAGQDVSAGAYEDAVTVNVDFWP